jgi:hypothetical protein
MALLEASLDKGDVLEIEVCLQTLCYGLQDAPMELSHCYFASLPLRHGLWLNIRIIRIQL